MSAQHDFTGIVEDGELLLKRGDIIQVIEADDADWWKGVCAGKTGLFPANHVVIIENSANAKALTAADVLEMEAQITPSVCQVLRQHLQRVDPRLDSLAENERLQQAYSKSLAMRASLTSVLDYYETKLGNSVVE